MATLALAYPAGILAAERRSGRWPSWPVEPAVWFMILGIGIVHWGLFAGIVAAYCAATVKLGMSMLTSGISGAATSAVAVLILALLPLLPLAISKARSEAPASP